MARNSFIVRVYGRPETYSLNNKVETLIGIVEDADTGMKYTFHNKDELWRFVTSNKEQVVDQPVKSDLIK